MERKTRKYAKSFDLTISYQTLSSNEKLGTNTESGTLPDIIRHKIGTALAPSLPTPMARTPPREASKDTDTVDLISNAGIIVIPDESTLPNEYEFEILRLRRRIEELECTVRDRDERNVRAIGMLEDELQMWRTFLHDHVKETHSGIQRRIIRLESTLITLQAKGSQVYPELKLPDSWSKTKV